jgi:hypothetical protein
MIASSVGCRIRYAALIFIACASALGAGNATEHRHNAHQPARGKCYRRNADSPAKSWPSIHRPE